MGFEEQVSWNTLTLIEGQSEKRASSETLAPKCFYSLQITLSYLILK